MEAGTALGPGVLSGGGGGQELGHSTGLSTALIVLFVPRAAGLNKSSAVIRAPGTRVNMASSPTLHIDWLLTLHNIH